MEQTAPQSSENEMETIDEIVLLINSLTWVSSTDEEPGSEDERGLASTAVENRKKMMPTLRYMDESDQASTAVEKKKKMIPTRESLVKDLLNEKVKLKMTQEGKTFGEDAQPQEPTIPTEKEKQRSAQAKERNRLSAERSRQKKKDEELRLRQSIEHQQARKLELVANIEDDTKTLFTLTQELVNLHKTPQICHDDSKGVALCSETELLVGNMLKFCQEEQIALDSDDQSLDFLSSHIVGEGSTIVATASEEKSSQVLCSSSSSGIESYDYRRQVATSASRASEESEYYVQENVTDVNDASTVGCVVINEEKVDCQGVNVSSDDDWDRFFNENVVGSGFNFNCTNYNHSFAEDGAYMNTPLTGPEKSFFNPGIMVDGVADNLGLQPPECGPMPIPVSVESVNAHSPLTDVSGVSAKISQVYFEDVPNINDAEICNSIDQASDASSSVGIPGNTISLMAPGGGRFFPSALTANDGDAEDYATGVYFSPSALTANDGDAEDYATGVNFSPSAWTVDEQDKEEDIRELSDLQDFFLSSEPPPKKPRLE